MSYYNVSVTPSCPAAFLGPSLAQVCSGSQYLIFMTLLDTFIRDKDSISELCERVRPVDPPENNYDFIVVGGGAAGAVVAARLSEIQQWKVLLLEAGPDEPPGSEVPIMAGKFLGTVLDWQYVSHERYACLSTGGICKWPRGKNLGGTAVHNGMLYMRGHPKDYEDWVAMGNKGWSWDEVLPYYKLSENNSEIDRVGREYHSTGGYLSVGRFPWKPAITDDLLAAVAERGYPLSQDLNGAQFTGFTVGQTMNRNGVRASSAAAFLRPIRNRPNLQVALNATVTKVIIEDLKVVGVQYYQNGKFRVAKASREVVVSGGAINSPQLLLLSGIGPKEHLQDKKVPVVKDLPGVGENLHNHVWYTLSFTINEPNTYDINWAAAVEYIAFQKGIMSACGLRQLTGILPSKYTTPNDPDLQFFFNGYSDGCAANGEIGARIDNGKRVIGIVPTNTHPISRGRLRLVSNDPFAKPIMTANYLSHPLDVARLVEGIQISLSLANSTAMRKHNMTLIHDPIPACSKYPYLSNEYWSCAVHQNTGPVNHQSGSCKMGPASDKLAVVDPQLRVHGIKGLRVADTSIMPKVISGNTCAPAIMIGERAAAFIKSDWGVASA